MLQELSEAGLEDLYRRTAEEYLRSLPLEHFMEATPQATQRKITLESLDLVTRKRADVHVFNELLVLYPSALREKPKPVVPDNMVVLHDGPITAVGSYDLPLQPAPPFLVLEYVSKSSERKDYVENMDRYEQELQVPYYLLFHPEAQDLALYHHKGDGYVAVRPNEHSRLPIPELELEVAILEGWTRFWFRGELLALPAALADRAEAAERDAEDERDARHKAEHRAENERKTRLEAQQRAEDERNARLEAQQRAATAEQRAENERKARFEAQQHAKEEKKTRLEAQQRAEAAEQELARLRAEMDRKTPKP